MRFLSTFVSVLLCSLCMFALLNGCSEKGKNQANSLALYASHVHKAIPELLPRNPSIGSVQEQEKVLSTYEMLKQSINRNPTDYRNRLKLAQLFMLEARATGEHGHYYPAALQVLNDLLNENPPQDVVFGAKSLKASVKLSLHQFKEAQKLAEEAIAINGYNALIYGSLVDAHVELGDYDLAVSMADKMMSIRPDIRSYSRVSYLREIHGDMKGAIESMQMAVKAGYPGYEETAWAGLILGELLEKEGRIKEAQEVYEGILAERKDYPFAIDALAGIEMKKGNAGKAEELLKRACNIIPEVGFYVRLAGLYQKEGKMSEAEKISQEILDMLADDEDKGHKMGMEYARVYMELFMDYDKALEYASKEHMYRPLNKDVNQLMAAIYLKKGDYPQAKKHLEVASQTQSTDAELICMQALVQTHEGNATKAKQILLALFDKNPYQDHTFVQTAKNLIGA